MAQGMDILNGLLKSLEAGNYDAQPSKLVQGSALQVEDLSPTMQVVTFEDKHIKLQKMLKVESCKSNLAQFNRILSYGIFGGSAQIEGAVGQEDTGDYVRVVVPMAFYSSIRRVTIVADMIETVDGKKASDREASNAAKKLSGDIEFDLFRGKEAFSNAGVFDGNPLAVPALPNILGLDTQIRQSDNQRVARDLMFAEYGSDETVVVAGGGTLSQVMIEDSTVRSAMNHGEADKLLVDPKVLSAYNKIALGKERIILAGSPQSATGADLRKQWTAMATVELDYSRFLSGKTGPAPARQNGPTAPASVTATPGAGSTSIAAGAYIYAVTSVNEQGESQKTVASAANPTAGQQVVVAITPPASGTVRYFNVYRTAAGGSAASAKFIGRVAYTGSSPTNFTDLGNKLPGFVTGFLVQGDTMVVKELAPYSNLKLAITDLSTPTAFFRFLTLAVLQPRKNVLIDNLIG